MFAGTIGSWRNPQQEITRVKGQSVDNKSKLKLFEDALDYITTSKSTPQELISEIMGFRETKCEAFKKLSIDNSLFFYKEITEEITYLLVVCFLKQVDQKLLSLNGRIGASRLKEWLTENEHSYAAKKIEDKYVNTVFLKDGKIFFNSTYKPIKLTNLEIGIDLIPIVKHTNKVHQLGIKDIYSNHTGKCLGATNYWLLMIANSYKKPHYQRQELKNKYVESLEIASVKFGRQTLKYIKNDKTKDIIEALQEGFYINDQFNQIQDIYTTNLSLGTDILKLLELMQMNQLPQLYVQILTKDHALGLAIITKGVLAKVLAYDPNDSNSYMSTIISPEAKDKSQLVDFCKRIHYFEEDDNIVAIVLRCYSFEIPPNQQQKFSKIANSIETYQTIKYPVELLRLGIVTDNQELVLLAATKYKARSKDCIAMAVRALVPKVVKLLIELIPEAINYVDEKGYTPLCYAVAMHHIELVYMLLNAAAKLNLPNSIDILILTRDKYPNKIIHNILLQRMKNEYNN